MNEEIQHIEYFNDIETLKDFIENAYENGIVKGSYRYYLTQDKEDYEHLSHYIGLPICIENTDLIYGELNIIIEKEKKKSKPALIIRPLCLHCQVVDDKYWFYFQS